MTDEPAGGNPPDDTPPPKKRGRGKPVRLKGQREADLALTADMYCRGFTQQEIADSVGVSRSMVFKDLETIRKRWLESSVRSFDMAKAIELERLDAMEREAWKAWRRSNETKQEIRGFTANDAKPDGEPSDPAKAVKAGKRSGRIQIRTSAGDPRFMLIILEVQKMRIKLLGLDAPQKDAPSDDRTVNDYVVAARLLPTDQLEAIVAYDEAVVKAKALPAPENGNNGR